MADDRECPECGGSMEGRRRNAKFCGRDCQLASFTRGRRSPAITIRLEPDDRWLLDSEAEAANLSTRRYVELLVERHLDALLTETEAVAS